MTSLLEADALQARLEELIAAHRVPGASVGVLHGDDVVTVASGIINLTTGVEATPDTLFQIGSITKVWTATLVMMLVDEGVLDLDTPVVTYLPEFKVADPNVTATVTLRHLLSHSSGIGGDHILETGRGDDNLERYVETCASLGQEHELGTTMSYCNTGFSVLGRVIEKVTGKSWDQVLKERIITPLGLEHTNTLPEEALLFRTAAGHVPVPDSEEMRLAPVWVLPRSAGPAGLINSTVADTLTFARLHLDDGVAPDGKQLLSVAAVKQMQQPQIEIPDRFTLGDKIGISWLLFNWDGHLLYGHDGATLGQRAYLRVLPEARLAVCLLTNGGESGLVFKKLCDEVMREVAGVASPPWPVPPATPPSLDLSNYEGAFHRLNVDVEISVGADGAVTATMRQSGELAEMLPPDQRQEEFAVVPVDRELFLASLPNLPMPMPMVFFDFDGDRPRRVHLGARAMSRPAD